MLGLSTLGITAMLPLARRRRPIAAHGLDLQQFLLRINPKPIISSTVYDIASHFGGRDKCPGTLGGHSPYCIGDQDVIIEKVE
jgi:hypothetical protein